MGDCATLTLVIVVPPIPPVPLAICSPFWPSMPLAASWTPTCSSARRSLSPAACSLVIHPLGRRSVQTFSPNAPWFLPRQHHVYQLGLCCNDQETYGRDRPRLGRQKGEGSPMPDFMEQAKKLASEHPDLVDLAPRQGRRTGQGKNRRPLRRPDRRHRVEDRRFSGHGHQ